MLVFYFLYLRGALFNAFPIPCFRNSPFCNNGNSKRIFRYSRRPFRNSLLHPLFHSGTYYPLRHTFVYGSFRKGY